MGRQPRFAAGHDVGDLRETTPSGRFAAISPSRALEGGESQRFPLADPRKIVPVSASDFGQSRICNKRLPLVKDFYQSIEGDCRCPAC